jgi:hypothetical protein
MPAVNSMRAKWETEHRERPAEQNACAEDGAQMRHDEVMHAIPEFAVRPLQVTQA